MPHLAFHAVAGSLVQAAAPLACLLLGEALLGLKLLLAGEAQNFLPASQSFAAYPYRPPLPFVEASARWR